MKSLAALAMFMFLVSPIVGVVALVFRVDVETWNTVTLLGALAMLILAIGGGINLYLRGRAKLEEARALNTAADARRIHGIPAPAPTFNTTVNMLVMRNPETGEVRYLPAQDPKAAGSMMRQYAMQGYQLDTKESVWKS